VKLAIVLFNLGGPDSPEAVEPFLYNLFSDPAIIALPWFLRKPLARFIARRRTPFAQKIYAHLGGRSPILEETQKQARALETVLRDETLDVRAFAAMRCWHPFSDGAAKAVKDWGAERIVLLPLYPQYSTTTTASSFKDWDRAARKAGLGAPTTRICCYPWEEGFVAAMAARIAQSYARARPGLSYRLLLSAHGLPRRIVEKGDPYRWQIEACAEAIISRLEIENPDWEICYQSRVGPMAWIGPSTDAEIRRAGREGKAVVVAPIAFVSEHSETLVELDIQYGTLAKDCGVPDYLRCPTVGIHGDFIAGLAALVRRAQAGGSVTSCEGGRLCPAPFKGCGFKDGS
jgi:ferrochelatase